MYAGVDAILESIPLGICGLKIKCDAGAEWMLVVLVNVTMPLPNELIIGCTAGRSGIRATTSKRHHNPNILGNPKYRLNKAQTPAKSVKSPNGNSLETP